MQKVAENINLKSLNVHVIKVESLPLHKHGI
jgi:hypothetical protein